MIYSPVEILDPRLALAQGIFSALTEAAIDFIAADNKPWTYYTGVALGQTAIAAGLPGAAVTMYVIADSVDLLLFHSPDGSLARVYIDGLQAAAIDAYNPVPSWITNTIGLVSGVKHRIDIINDTNTNGDKTSPINWLAIGPVTVNGGTADARSIVHVSNLSYIVRDAETNSKPASHPVYLPSGLTIAAIQQWSDAYAPLLDAVTGGTIEGVSVTFDLTLPGGLKGSPDASITNERGGLISFDTTGPRKDSVWIPAMKFSIMPGNEFSLANAAVANLIGYLNSVNNSIRPRTPQDYQYTTARSGKKSIRK